MLDLAYWRAKLESIRIVTPSGCWDHTQKYNRGKINIGGRKIVFLERLALATRLGLDINDRTWLACHCCDNDRCFNPDHLYKGTYSSNALDNSPLAFKIGKGSGHYFNPRRLG